MSIQKVLFISMHNGFNEEFELDTLENIDTVTQIYDYYFNKFKIPVKYFILVQMDENENIKIIDKHEKIEKQSPSTNLILLSHFDRYAKRRKRGHSELNNMFQAFNNLYSTNNLMNFPPGLNLSTSSTTNITNGTSDDEANDNEDDDLSEEDHNEDGEIPINNLQTIINSILSQPPATFLPPPLVVPDIYKESIKQLENMGFTNKRKNLEALQVCDGNVENAVNYLISYS